MAAFFLLRKDYKSGEDHFRDGKNPEQILETL